MLDIAKRTPDEAEVMDRVTVVHGDAGQLTDLFGAAAFDVILCHNLLKYVDDPTLVLRGATRTLRGNSAILSIVVRNQMGEVFKAAIKAGDLTAAETNLSAAWEFESLYGGRVRFFTSGGLRAMSTSESLESIAERGVSVVADYLPPNISRTAQYERIFELERTLGAQPEFAANARYTHCLARRRENRT
jgi:S-adenosylmethionine-dependent methyltransferase